MKPTHITLSLAGWLVWTTLCLGTGSAWAQSTSQPAATSQPAPAQTRATDRRGAETITIANLKVSVWRPVNQQGPAPLVIFSHGFHGISTQSTFLMRAMADAGYLVLAPNHKDALGNPDAFTRRPEVGFMQADQWKDTTYKDRGDDIRSLIEALKADQKWSAQIDWSRLALAGHSLGGYTVLGLAGAWPSWKLPNVKAVLALSPYCAPYVHNKSLKLDVPVMYQTGTRDIGIRTFVRRPGGAYDQSAAPAYFVEFDQAGHFAWTDLTGSYHASIVYYSLGFLNLHLNADPTINFKDPKPDVAEFKSK